MSKKILDKKKKFSFSKNLIIEASARGMVTARVSCTGISATAYMDEKFYREYGELVNLIGNEEAQKRWREEMKKLENAAIEMARNEFNSLYKV